MRPGINWPELPIYARLGRARRLGAERHPGTHWKERTKATSTRGVPGRKPSGGAKPDEWASETGGPQNLIWGETRTCIREASGGAKPRPERRRATGRNNLPGKTRFAKQGVSLERHSSPYRVRTPQKHRLPNRAS